MVPKRFTLITMSMYNGATTKTYVAAMNSMEKSTPSMVTDPTTNKTTIIKALNSTAVTTSLTPHISNAAPLRDFDVS